MNPNRPDLKSKSKKDLIRRLDATESAYIDLVRTHRGLLSTAQDAYIRLVCVLTAAGGTVDVPFDALDEMAPVEDTEVHAYDVGTEENPIKRFSLTPEPTDAD